MSRTYSGFIALSLIGLLCMHGLTHSVTELNSCGKIVFVKGGGIYVMNEDGTSQTRLIKNSGKCPAWSPDGTKIAFIRSEEIYIMDADGSNQTSISASSSYWAGGPAWSPDSERIVFSSWRGNGCRIYVVNADGSNERSLTRETISGSYPAWAPDGTKIAFVSKGDIYVVNTDGSNLRQLTDHPAEDVSPAWAPDGTKIAFHSGRGRDGDTEIYVMDASGHNVKKLTDNIAFDEDPVWSPDGTEIAFASNRDGNWQIYVMDADGSNQRSLAVGSSPSWCCPGCQSDSDYDGVPDKSDSCYNPGCSIVDATGCPKDSDSDGIIDCEDNCPYEKGDSSNEGCLLDDTDVGSSVDTDVGSSVDTDVDPSSENLDLVSIGMIIFFSNRDGNSEIYIMDADGSNMKRLTDNSADERFPAWSPDGTKIAFVSNRDGNSEIYVMDADGSNQVNLTNNPALDEDPAWSPDGTKIAFVRMQDIYVMNVDGSNQKRLTLNRANDCQPAWSPDGTKIAFASSRDGNWEIYVMDADGSNQVNLTNSIHWHGVPAWSPDGTKIAFASNRDGNWEIYVMDADGSNQVNLTGNTDWDSFPAWSPDGTKIAFASNRDGNFEIYIMNIDGSDQENLTRNPATDLDPSWSCTRELLLFYSAQLLLQQAEKAFNNFEFQEALDTATEARKVYEDLQMTRDVSSVDGVLLRYQTALDAEKLAEKGNSLREAGKYDAAIQDLTEAHQKFQECGVTQKASELEITISEIDEARSQSLHRYGYMAIIIGAVAVLLILSMAVIIYRGRKKEKKGPHALERDKKNLDEMLSKGLISKKEYEIAKEEIEKQLTN